MALKSVSHEWNKYGRKVLRGESHDGYKGTAEICWIDDGSSVPHWSAFVIVPFKPAKWSYLGRGEDQEIEQKAVKALNDALEACSYI